MFDVLCRTVTCTKELISVYICYSQGMVLILPCLDYFFMCTYIQLYSELLQCELCTVPSNPVYLAVL